MMHLDNLIWAAGRKDLCMNNKVYLQAVEINMILEALHYTAEQVKSSCGEIAPFMVGCNFANSEEQAELMLYMAQECERIEQLIMNWQDYGEDCELIAIK